MKKYFYNVFILIFFMKLFTSSLDYQNGFPNIAGIKTPYYLTDKEKIIIEGLNKEIKNIFSCISDYQTNNLIDNSIKPSKDFSQSRKNVLSKKQFGGKSLFQIKNDKARLKKFPEINQINVMKTSSYEKNSLNQNTMTMGERIIYYKEKYLNLGKKYFLMITNCLSKGSN